MNKINKRGQMVLWIILAVLFVAALLLFAYTGRKIKIDDQSILHPGSAIESCVEEGIKEITEKIMPQGGFENPSNYILYKNTKIEYICKNPGSYIPCIQQHPLFLEEIRQTIENHLKEKVDGCFRGLEIEYERRATDVQLGSQSLEVRWGSGKIYTNITREMILKKGDKMLTVLEFPVQVNHPLFNLGSVAIEIANQEARYCHFDTLGYAILSPEYFIKKQVLSDESSIYQIQDIESKKELWVAVRSCAVPYTLGEENK